MKYFVLSVLADAGTSSYCFADGTPDGIATRWYRLMTGKAFGDDYPSAEGAVTLGLGKDYPGLVLPSFMGNTTGAIVVDNGTADVIMEHRVGRTERLPFVLLDHKRRVYSKDYVFLNPLEMVNGLHETESVVRRSSKGEIKEVKKLVLDRRKLEAAFDVFRLGECSDVYLFSEVVVEALRHKGCTNFHFEEAAAL